MSAPWANLFPSKKAVTPATASATTTAAAPPKLAGPPPWWNNVINKPVYRPATIIGAATATSNGASPSAQTKPPTSTQTTPATTAPTIIPTTSIAKATTSAAATPAAAKKAASTMPKPSLVPPLSKAPKKTLSATVGVASAVSAATASPPAAAKPAVKKSLPPHPTMGVSTASVAKSPAGTTSAPLASGHAVAPVESIADETTSSMDVADDDDVVTPADDIIAAVNTKKRPASDIAPAPVKSNGNNVPRTSEETMVVADEPAPTPKKTNSPVEATTESQHNEIEIAADCISVEDETTVDEAHGEDDVADSYTGITETTAAAADEEAASESVAVKAAYRNASTIPAKKRGGRPTKPKVVETVQVSNAADKELVVDHLIDDDTSTLAASAPKRRKPKEEAAAAVAPVAAYSTQEAVDEGNVTSEVPASAATNPGGAKKRGRPRKVEVMIDAGDGTLIPAPAAPKKPRVRKPKQSPPAEDTSHPQLPLPVEEGALPPKKKRSRAKKVAIVAALPTSETTGDADDDDAPLTVTSDKVPASVPKKPRQRRPAKATVVKAPTVNITLLYYNHKHPDESIFLVTEPDDEVECEDDLNFVDSSDDEDLDVVYDRIFSDDLGINPSASSLAKTPKKQASSMDVAKVVDDGDDELVEPDENEEEEDVIDEDAVDDEDDEQEGVQEVVVKMDVEDATSHAEQVAAASMPAKRQRVPVVTNLWTPTLQHLKQTGKAAAKSPSPNEDDVDAGDEGRQEAGDDGAAAAETNLDIVGLEDESVDDDDEEQDDAISLPDSETEGERIAYCDLSRAEKRIAAKLRKEYLEKYTAEQAALAAAAADQDDDDQVEVDEDDVAEEQINENLLEDDGVPQDMETPEDDEIKVEEQKEEEEEEEDGGAEEMADNEDAYSEADAYAEEDNVDAVGGASE